MSKTVWKLLVIIGFAALCVWQIYPPQSRLKPGIDIAGGTSLLYEIDTTGMAEWQKREASSEMIRVLQQRVDPDNQMNLIWRPQGSNRIEIQMPLASREMQEKRRVYQDLRSEIEADNLPRRAVEYALSRQSDEKDEASYLSGRLARLESLSKGSPERLAKLQAVATAQDGLERVRQHVLEAALKKQSQIQEQVQGLDLPLGQIDALRQKWTTLSDPCQAEELKGIAGEDAAKQTLIRDYIAARLEVSSAREALAGADAAYQQAWSVLESDNIDVERLERFLDRKGKIRDDEIARLKLASPGMAGKLDALVASYDAFASKAGRLDDPEDLKKKLQGSGVLEFRILPIPGEQNALDAAAVERYRDRLRKYGPNPAKSGDKDFAWRKVRDPENFKASGIIENFAGDVYVLASNKSTETLLKGDGNWSLKTARPDTDRDGGWAVAFEFNAIGASRFAELTRNNLKRALAILLDEEVFSAPMIQSVIGAHGQITGKFSQKEVQDLVDKLNAGSLPARLGDQPISMNSVGATMGKENIEAGFKAAVIGLIAVIVFMILYYHFAGLLAAIALLMNLLIILAVMAFTRATFTMPGIAALILTIGMAVDANVLIFERIREEQRRGSSLRIAIKNGYDRAFRTILDANITTFITAFILRLVASEEVKGFALTLMIGIVTSMFTALFVTHVIFDLMTERRLLNKLTMFGIFQHAKFNWIGARKLFIPLSMLLVLGSWGVYVERHVTRAENSPYSIEFTGGTSARVVLAEKGSDLTRDAIEKMFETYDAEQQAAGSSDPPLGARVQRIGLESHHEYEIVTTATNLTVVDLGFGAEKADAASLQAKIQQEAKERGDDRMGTSLVKVQDGRLILETSQTSKRRVREILAAPGVLPEGVVIDEGMIHTREVVTSAINKVLKDYLTQQNNLQPVLTTTPITENVLAQRQYLGQHVLGGLLIEARFSGDARESLNQLEKRFTAYRLKEERNAANTFTLYARNGEVVDRDEPLDGVVIAVVSSTAVYDPEGSAAEKEAWNTFTAKQAGWFTGAMEEAETLPWVTQIDPSIGRKSMNDAIVAVAFSLLAIIVYIWIRFGTVRFGWSAALALVHDVSIALGMVAASGWISRTAIGEALLISDFKIDLPMIAGFLTVIGYSLNDTIVIFDRIRENRGKLAVLNSSVINRSINETLSRTTLTSFTTLLVLVVMYILGGPGLRGFNYVMIIGVLIGTYSSVAIAAPLLCGAAVEEKKTSVSTDAASAGEASTTA